MTEQTDVAVLSEQVRGLRRDFERFETRYLDDRKQRQADDRWLRRIFAASLIAGAIGIGFSIFQNGLVNLTMAAGG